MTIQTTTDARPLEFSIALRGYDRIQVDEYIDRLHALLEEADDRVRRAEAPQDAGQHAEVGPRITQIFELARAEAAEVRDRARREAHELVSSARTESEALLRANQQEWDRLLDEYETERERIREEVRALSERKATVLGELHRLREALGSASGLAAGPEAELTRELPVRTGPAEDGSEPVDALLVEGDAEDDAPATVPLRRVS